MRNGNSSISIILRTPTARCNLPHEDVRKAYVPIFEEAGVNMVFCGHNHLYERSAPIREGKIVEEGDGIVYVVTGAGGASRYEENSAASPLIRSYNDVLFSFTLVEVSPERLKCRRSTSVIAVIDEYVIESRKPREESRNHRRSHRSAGCGGRFHEGVDPQDLAELGG